MGVYALLTFRQPLPTAVSDLVRPLAAVRERGVSIYELESVPWEKVFDTLEAHGVTSLSGPPTFGERANWTWGSPDPAWVAAVLAPDHVQPGCNPPEDYDPVLPPPHRGHVRRGRPVHVRERPRGRLARAGEDNLFSTELINALGGTSAGERGEAVVLRDEAVPGWARFYPARRCRVLDPACFYPAQPCAVCGSPLLPALGLWIGGEGAAFSAAIGEEGLGHGHAGRQHPLVVSLEQAARLHRLFRGKGFCLEPVYRQESTTAVLVFRVLERAKSFMP
jgi:hypothetical protein